MGSPSVISPGVRSAGTTRKGLTAYPGASALLLIDTNGDETTTPETTYAKLAGRAGGQTLVGGTAASELLILQSTSHATRGYVKSVDPVRVYAPLGVKYAEVLNDDTYTILRSSDATGSNAAAASTKIGPGRSTGNATPASVILQSTVAGPSGAAAQTLLDTLTVANGQVIVAGTVDSKGLAIGGVTANDPLLVKSGSTVGGSPALSLFDATIGAWASMKARGFYFGPNDVWLNSTVNRVNVVNSADTEFRDLAIRALFAGSQSDAAAANSSLYYSTTASALVWKDAAGVVHALY
jgi:hypothetical protein